MHTTFWWIITLIDTEQHNSVHFFSCQVIKKPLSMSWHWATAKKPLFKLSGKTEITKVNRSLYKLDTAFIKDWVVALWRAWRSWQWVTPFRRGFALCSIISHYYMSHLLPRNPMGEEESRTQTHTYRWYPACLAPIIPKANNTLWHLAKKELPFTATFTHLHN